MCYGMRCTSPQFHSFDGVENVIFIGVSVLCSSPNDRIHAYSIAAKSRKMNFIFGNSCINFLSTRMKTSKATQNLILVFIRFLFFVTFSHGFEIKSFDSIAHSMCFHFLSFSLSHVCVWSLRCELDEDRKRNKMDSLSAIRFRFAGSATGNRVEKTSERKRNDKKKCYERRQLYIMGF